MEENLRGDNHGDQPPRGELEIHSSRSHLSGSNSSVIARLFRESDVEKYATQICVFAFIFPIPIVEYPKLNLSKFLKNIGGFEKVCFWGHPFR